MFFFALYMCHNNRINISVKSQNLRFFSVRVFFLSLSSSSRICDKFSDSDLAFLTWGHTTRTKKKKKTTVKSQKNAKKSLKKFLKLQQCCGEVLKRKKVKKKVAKTEKSQKIAKKVAHAVKLILSSLFFFLSDLAFLIRQKKKLKIFFSLAC